jgi:hypothetical protein
MAVLSEPVIARTMWTEVLRKREVIFFPSSPSEEKKKIDTADRREAQSVISSHDALQLR